MEEQLRDKVTVVTGGASGIGKATALAFSREGANVVVADISVEMGDEVVSMIKQVGGDAIFVKTDVSQAAQVQSLVQSTVNTYGRLDYACNNAGIEGLTASTAECSEDNWDRTININLKGVWLCMKYEIPEMLKQRTGTIVNIASAAGLVGFAGLPAYAASKGGIVQLTRTAALEYAKLGIRINSVCPGGIETPMIDRLSATNAGLEDPLSTAHPMGRLGKPEEIAQAVVWLCSDAASFVTGHPMVIDGGYVAQ